MTAGSKGPFKHRSRWSLGVEIGQIAFRIALVHKPGKGEARLVECREFPLHPNLKDDFPGRARFLGDALSEMMDLAHGRTSLWTSIQPDEVRVHQLEVADLPDNQLASAVFWAAQREDPFEASQYLMDFEKGHLVTSVEDDEAKRIVTCYIVEKKTLRQMENLFLAAGFPLDGIMLPMRAAGHVARSLSPGEGAFAVAHLGEHTSRMAVVENGDMRVMRSVPVGVHTLTETVTTAFSQRISEEECLRLLREGNPGSLKEDISEHLQAGLNRLGRQLERTVSYYQNQTRNYGQIGSFLITGPFCDYPDLVKRLQETLPLPLVLADPGRIPGFQSTPPENGDGTHLPLQATACGIALSALDEGHNFLHPFGVRAEEMRTQKQSRWVVGIFALLVFFGGAVYGYDLWQLRSAKDSLRALSERGQQSGLADMPVILAQHRATLNDHEEALQALAKRRLGEAVLSIVSRRCPPEVSLLQVRGDWNHTDTEPGAEEPVSLTIEGLCEAEPGTAESLVHLFAKSLTETPFIEGASVVSFKTQPESYEAPAIFTIEIPLKVRNGISTTP